MSGFNIPACFTNKMEMMVKDMLNTIRCINNHLPATVTLKVYAV